MATNPRMAAIAWLCTCVGCVIGIAGLIITTITIKKKELSYRYETTELVEKEVAKAQDITILYKGKSIESLSVTNFYIQNTGNTQINVTEMVKGFELMVVGAVEIISVEIEKVSHIRVTKDKSVAPINDANNDTNLNLDKYDISFIKPNSKYAVVKIPFNAFQKKDLMVMNIYHTGGNDTVFKLLGTGNDLKIVNRLPKEDLQELLLDFEPHSLSMALAKRIMQRLIK